MRSSARSEVQPPPPLPGRSPARGRCQPHKNSPRRDSPGDSRRHEQHRHKQRRGGARRAAAARGRRHDGGLLCSRAAVGWVPAAAAAAAASAHAARASPRRVPVLVCALRCVRHAFGFERKQVCRSVSLKPLSEAGCSGGQTALVTQDGCCPSLLAPMHCARPPAVAGFSHPRSTEALHSRPKKY